MSAYALAILIFSACTHLAWAQETAATTAVAVEQLEPAPASGMMGVYDARILPAWELAAGMHVYYSSGMLQIVDAATQQRTSLIGTRLGTELTGAVGFFDVADVGLAVRGVPYQQGTPHDAVDPAGVSGFALGDLRVVPRASVWRSGDFRLAVVAPLTIPVGDDMSFNSDGRPRLAGIFAADYSAASGMRLAANVGYELREQRRLLNYVSDDVLRWGAAGDVPIGQSRLSVTGSVFGTVPVAAADQAASTEVLLGAGWKLMDSVHATLAGGVGLGRAVGTPQYRILTELRWAPAPPPRAGVPTSIDPVADETQTDTDVEDEGTDVALVEPPPVVTGTIRGVVHDRDSGEPLADVEVTCGDQKAVTDLYGRYELSVPVGEAEVVVHASGYSAVRQTVQVTEGLARELAIQVRVTQTANRGTISGDVRARAGQPLQASLSIRSAQGETRMVRTDASGRFETELDVGTYTVRIQARGYADKVRRVDVRPGELTIYNFLLSPAP